MSFGFFASQESYRQHLRPIWEALEPEERGAWAETRVHQPTWVTPSIPVRVWIAASHRDSASLYRLQTPRVHMEHGVGLQWYPKQQLHHLIFRSSAIAAPNEFIAQRYRELKKRLRVEVIGTPKLDHLAKLEPGAATAISFHWSGVMRQNPTSLTLWRPLIEELAGERELLGHAHPKIWQRARKFYDAIGIEPVQDFAEVCRRASLYLCDHSSTLYEWAALDRELILLRRPGHREQIPQLSGLGWDHFTGIGPELKLGGSLRAALEAAADHQFRAVRQEATAALYPYIGSATRRAIDLLHEIEEDVHAN